MKTRLKQLSRQAIISVLITVHTFSLGMLWFLSRQVSDHVVEAAVPAQQAPLPQQAISGNPVQIIIPSVSINVAIVPGEYNPSDSSWTLGGYTAQVATMLAPANNISGNTFIYGHNNRFVFAQLEHVQPGATVEIITDNGNHFFYKYMMERVVPPTDTSLFTYYGKPILTLQTCTGAWFEQRHLIYFSFDYVVQSPQEIIKSADEKRRATINTIATPIKSIDDRSLLPN
jgi:LPXTG-site transpeptidase (sortase) family protein